MEFRRVPAAGNLFVNRIAIVKDIYLPTSASRTNAKFECLDFEGTGLLSQRMRPRELHGVSSFRYVVFTAVLFARLLEWRADRESSCTAGFFFLQRSLSIFSWS